MNIYIYESSSRGGCFDYSLCLAKAYLKAGMSVQVLVPSNTPDIEQNKVFCLRSLLSDDPASKFRPYRLAHFMFRQFVNPLILLFALINKKKSIVIINDFEQISAPLWGPLYRLLLRRHIFIVVLHDPDRDNYPPFKWLSTFCMKQMMKVMHWGLYHEALPEKEYYKNKKTTYLKVPHGLFESPAPNKDLSLQISSYRGGGSCMAIIGNIRYEKNYELAIEALTRLSDWKLIIAGAPANSTVSTEVFKRKAEELGISDRILWIERFLSDEEMASVIKEADLILLYYKKTFASQSGILNMVAPFGKQVLISDTASAMAETAKKYDIGVIVVPDDLDALVRGVLLSGEKMVSGWKNYKKYASWERHVNIVLNSLQVKNKVYETMVRSNPQLPVQ